MRRGYCALILGSWGPWRLLSNRLVLADTDEDLAKIARIALQLPVTSFCRERLSELEICAK